MLELSFERLALLARLDDTALLSHRVFPALRYFLRRGEVGGPSLSPPLMHRDYNSS